MHIYSFHKCARNQYSAQPVRLYRIKVIRVRHTVETQSSDNLLLLQKCCNKQERHEGYPKRCAPVAIANSLHPVKALHHGQDVRLAARAPDAHVCAAAVVACAARVADQHYL